MAFTDNTVGGRIIEEGLDPVFITLAGTVEVGDLLCYNSGWVVADSDALATSNCVLIAGAPGVSGDLIVAFHRGVIGNITTGTAGNELFLSATAGGYAAAAGTIPVVVGRELGVYPGSTGGMGRILVDPRSTLVSDRITMADGVCMIGVTGLTKDYSLKAYGSTGVAFKVIEVINATTAGGQTKVKLGFFGATPVIKPTSLVAATATQVHTQFNTLKGKLEALGLLTAT